MSVHVVCPEPDGDRILARLARTLCEQTGWALSDAPDKRADCNIFIPYLTLPQGWDGSKSATWFTHPDPTIRGKGEMWGRIAASVALRTCSARQYLPDLQRFGPSALVTPPLDRDRFRPYGALRHSAMPRIGISGWNYPGGRKGPKLAAALMDAWPDGIRAHLTAIGEGWIGWPTKRISDSELPDWYRSLDVYVSTSLVEGVGYGPLEALACGVPVVISNGVGIFDDLPEMEGIIRYPVGDVRGMLSAVDRALAAPVDQDALRSTTEPYTSEAWAATWSMALESVGLDTGEGKLTSGVYESVSKFPARKRVVQKAAAEYSVNIPTNLKAGVAIVAYGKPARECARRLLESLDRWAPRLTAGVISDLPLLHGKTLQIYHPDTDLGGRGPKTLLDSLVPEEWEIVLYLDADVELVGPIDGLIAPLLDGWDWVICPNPARYALIEHGRRPDNQEEIDATVEAIGSDQLLQWNGGVFAYRRTPQTRALMAAWHTQWQVYGKRDQAALDRALWANPVRTWIVGREFNCVTRYDTQTPRTAILHHSLEARRWKGIIGNRLDEALWASLHPEPPKGVVRAPEPR